MTQRDKSALKGGKQHIEIACEDGGVLDYKSLKPFQGSLKTLTKENYERLRGLILKYGFTAPIHVWKGKDGLYTIDGHQRCRTLELMQKEGIDIPPVPVVMVKARTHNDAKRILLAHTSQIGQMERQGLYEFISENKIGYDELVQTTRFDAIDFVSFKAEFYEDSSQASGGGGTGDADSIPEVPKNIHKVKRGQVWKLGEHRLMCGDSTSQADVAKLLDVAKPNLMVTDPPYGIEYEASWRADAKDRKKTDREQVSNLQNDNRADWFDAWKLFPGNVVYVWHASAFTDVVMTSLRKAGFEIKQQIIWNKNVHALSRSHYHWKHEPCWFAIKEGENANWMAGRDQMTVWDIPSIIFEKDKTSHPTQKPVAIYERPIVNHSKEGDTVYEPFGGSGSAIMACEKLKRVSLTMELDEHFCSVIIERWQKFTGKEAIRL